MTKKKLNEISRLLNGYAFKSSKYVQSGLRVIRIANVQDGYLSDSEPCFYPIETTTKLEQFLLKPHDLLMSLTGNVGRVAFIEKEYLPAGLNQRVECIRPFNESDKEYLYYFFRSPMFQRESLKASHGSAQLNLSTVWLANFYVAYPDEEKRKTAVNTLRTIDNLIREKRNQLIELDSLVKSRFMEMFGDPNHDDLSKSLPLEKCVTIRDEMRKPINGVTRAKMQAGELFPYYGATGQVGTINEYLSDFEALCIAEDCGNYGPNEDSTYVISGKCWVNNHAHLIQCNKNVDIRYLQHYLNFLDITQYINGATRSKLTQSALKTLPILVPSMDQQLEFKRTMELIDKSRFVVHSRYFL